MTTNVAVKTEVQLPAHLLSAFEGIESNIHAGVSVPTLSFKNKVWSVREGEQVRQITLESGGVSVPSPIVDVVIVGKNKSLSRMYYDGPFAEGLNTAPTCTSIDGVTPDKFADKPQARSCAECPHNVVGSKLAQDRVTPIKACGTNQRLVVVPAKDITSKPLLLTFRGNSLYDPENSDNEKLGKFCYSGYEKSLTRNSVSNTAMVITRIGFDTRPHISGTKLLFERLPGWIDASQASAVIAHMKSDEVDALATGRLAGMKASTATPLPAQAPQAVQAIAVAAAAAAAEPTVEADKPAKAQKKPPLKAVPPAAPPAEETPEQMKARIRAEVMAEMTGAPAAAPEPSEPVVVDGDDEIDAMLAAAGFKK
jgi:hypothetical protein